MAVEIKYHADKNELLSNVSDALVQSIENAGDKPILLLLSGGSCLTLLPNLQHALFDKGKTLPNLTIGMVDERFDEQQSNFVTLKREYGEFYQAAIDHGVTFIDTSPKGKDQYEMADWYDKKLSALSPQLSAQNGTIIVLLGMGPDGHIAGILPFPDSEQQQFYETFLDTDRFVVGYDATGKNQCTKRFTVTFPVLLSADYVFAFITGDEKKASLENALKNNPPLHRCPAYYFHISPQKISLFTSLDVP